MKEKKLFMKLLKLKEISEVIEEMGKPPREIIEIFEGASKSKFGKIKYFLSSLRRYWRDPIWYYYQFTNRALPKFLQMEKFKSNY